ncbi:S1 family peptidase [Actinoplanes couchii]|uniref:Esterase n=1 Tax=Actinoplanes couchii TaxID=403638 RepID=A0ABQ3XNI5_9ACTN|nr:trypsin-like serine protease [Actinoplanes couchii]MDR6318011.1 secreted trypsin-like serine protease [Actinoplanes couchii]GID60071.1 esterase [Actinoplanes couchii]
MRRTTGSLLLTGTLLAGAFGGALPANAIANGEAVPIGKYGFSVKLTMTGIPTADGGKRDSACSGALINRRWVITAGHCFRDANGVRVERPVADETTATVGRTDLTSNAGTETTVVAVRQSPTADVALARLAEPVGDVEPIVLSPTAPKVGAQVRLTGYGSVTSTNPVPETRLRTGTMKVAEVTASVTELTGNATPCPYDSGGPFFLQTRGGPRLVAVVSNGPSCPHDEYEHAARTDNITGWIKGQIRE